MTTARTQKEAATAGTVTANDPLKRTGSMTKNTIASEWTELSDEDRREAIAELVEMLDASESGIIHIPSSNALWRSPDAPLFVARARLAHLSDRELQSRAFVAVYDRFDGKPDTRPDVHRAWTDAAGTELTTAAFLAVQNEINVAVTAGDWLIVGLGHFALRETAGPDLVYQTFEGYQLLRSIEATAWATEHAAQLAAVRPSWSTAAPHVEIEDGRAIVEFTGDIGMVALGAVVLMDSDQWTLARPDVVIPSEPPIEDVFALAADLTEAGVAALAEHDPAAAARLEQARAAAAALRGATSNYGEQAGA